MHLNAKNENMIYTGDIIVRPTYYVTCSGETEQVGVTSFSLVINSAGYIYQITIRAFLYLEGVELPFNN